jgi:hypothetical protein
MTRPAYVVTVTRDANLWAAQIDGLPPGCIGATDVEHFADLDVDVRDLVAGLTDTAPDAFDLDWHYVQNDYDYTAALDHAREWQRRLAEAEANRDHYRTAAAQEMTRAGLSQRAIGDALGMSHQRIGQILAAPAVTERLSRRVG